MNRNANPADVVSLAAVAAHLASTGKKLFFVHATGTRPCDEIGSGLKSPLSISKVRDMTHKGEQVYVVIRRDPTRVYAAIALTESATGKILETRREKGKTVSYDGATQLWFDIVFKALVEGKQPLHGRARAPQGARWSKARLEPF